MKTILRISSIIFLLNAGLSHAQIILTQSNMPVVGDIAIIADDTTCTAPVGNAGANQVWNLATLHNHSADTLYFVDPSSTPAHSSFPASNLAEKRFDRGTGSYYYTYFTVTPEFSDVLGFNYSSVQGTTTVAYDPPMKSIVFPFTYSTTFTDTTHYSISYAYPVPPYDSMRVSFCIIYKLFADGWGAVTTPAHTYSNCLRWSRADNNFDSTFYHNSATGVWSFSGYATTGLDTTYEWVANTVNFQPANISHIPGVKPASTANYLLSFIPLAIHASSGQSTMPSFQTAHGAYRLSENATMAICDLHGRVVKQVKGVAGQTISFQRSNLPHGIYCIRLMQGGHQITSELFVNVN